MSDATGALVASGLASVEQRQRYIDFLVELHPERMCSHLHQGWHVYNIERDKEAALTHFQNALEVAEKIIDGTARCELGHPGLAFADTARTLVEVGRRDDASRTLQRYNNWMIKKGQQAATPARVHAYMSRAYVLLAKGYKDNEEHVKADQASVLSLKYLEHSIEACRAQGFYGAEKIQPGPPFSYFNGNKEFILLHNEARECLELSRAKK